MKLSISKSAGKWILKNGKKILGSHSSYIQALKEMKGKKLADYISPGEMRRLPPPGVMEVWKGRTQKPLPYSEFQKKMKFREPELPNYEIQDIYQDYLEWFKTKGRGYQWPKYA